MLLFCNVDERSAQNLPQSNSLKAVRYLIKLGGALMIRLVDDVSESWGNTVMWLTLATHKITH